MNQRRRAREALPAVEEQTPPTARLSVLGARCVSELAISGAAVTVLTHRGDGNEPEQLRHGLVYATDETSSRLEDLQLTVGEGPCWEAFTTGNPVLVEDLATERWRWPAFTPQASVLGAAAVFSFPLHLGASQQLGTLNCYRATPGPLGAVAVTEARSLAELTTQTITGELDGHDPDDLSWVSDPHEEIHQACGMVQVQLGLPSEAALLRLRAHAYAHEVALADVARQVVARDLRFDTGSDSLA